VIERRGTGGGNFRLMYARFLDEAGYEESALAGKAAELWSTLAESFRSASEQEEPKPEIWSAIGGGTDAVLEAEERLWTALAGRASAAA